MILEFLAFHAYWYTPAGNSFSDSMRKFTDRMSTITVWMKGANAALVVFATILFVQNTVDVRLLSREELILLFAMAIGLRLLSWRWISYSKRISKKVAEFQSIEEPE